MPVRVALRIFGASRAVDRDTEPKSGLGLVSHIAVLILLPLAAARSEARWRRRQLLEAQRDPPSRGVDPDDLHLQSLADLEHIPGPLYVIPRELRDVQQAFDPDQIGRA